jgi:hypothetical protein
MEDDQQQEEQQQQTLDLGNNLHWYNEKTKKFCRAKFNPENIVYGEPQRANGKPTFIPRQYRVVFEDGSSILVPLRLITPKTPKNELVELTTVFGAQQFTGKTKDGKEFKTINAYTCDWSLRDYDKDTGIGLYYNNVKAIDDQDTKMLLEKHGEWYPSIIEPEKMIESLERMSDKIPSKKGDGKEYDPQIRTKWIVVPNKNHPYPSIVYDNKGKEIKRVGTVALPPKKSYGVSITFEGLLISFDALNSTTKVSNECSTFQAWSQQNIEPQQNGFC